MTSIKTDDFNKSLSRIFAKTEQPKKTTITSAKGFDNYLASIENKSSKSEALATEKAVMGPTKAPQPELPKFESQTNQLTNQREGEEIPAFKIAPSPLSSQSNSPSSSYIIGDIPMFEEAESVKKEPQAVKVPDAPVIVTSKRINLPPGKELESVMFGKDEIKSIVVTAGKYHGLDPSLGLAVAQVESAFNPEAVSRDGYHSKGIFQLLDSTAGDMIEHVGVEENYKPFDPSMNSLLGLGYLRRLHDIFSKDTNLTSSLKTHGAKSADDLEKIALAAYNAGEGNVARAQNKAQSLGKDPTEFSSIEPHLPTITRGYVKRVGMLKEKMNIEITKEDIA